MFPSAIMGLATTPEPNDMSGRLKIDLAPHRGAQSHGVSGELRMPQIFQSATDI